LSRSSGDCTRCTWLVSYSIEFETAANYDRFGPNLLDREIGSELEC
jgi:hypothetical protein